MAMVINMEIKNMIKKYSDSEEIQEKLNDDISVNYIIKRKVFEYTYFSISLQKLQLIQ